MRRSAKFRKSREPSQLNEFHAVIFPWTVFFRTAHPYSDGYHLKREGMPLHDAVGINCKKGAATENQGASVKFVCLMIVCYLT